MFKNYYIILIKGDIALVLYRIIKKKIIRIIYILTYANATINS